MVSSARARPVLQVLKMGDQVGVALLVCLKLRVLQGQVRFQLSQSGELDLASRRIMVPEVVRQILLLLECLLGDRGRIRRRFNRRLKPRQSQLLSGECALPICLGVRQGSAQALYLLAADQMQGFDVASAGPDRRLKSAEVAQAVVKGAHLGLQFEGVLAGLSVANPLLDLALALLVRQYTPRTTCPQLALCQAHRHLDDVGEVDALLDHGRHHPVQVGQGAGPERKVLADGPKGHLLLGLSRRAQDHVTVVRGGQPLVGLDAELDRSFLCLFLAQEAALMDEELPSVPAAKDPVAQGVRIIGAPAQHRQAQLVVRAPLVLERDRTHVGGQHKPYHVLLTLLGVHDGAVQVPEEQGQEPQCRGLANPVLTQNCCATPGIDSRDAATGLVLVGADVDEHHAAQAITGGVNEHAAGGQSLKREVKNERKDTKKTSCPAAFIGLGPVNTNREVRPRPAQSRGSRETWRRASRIERRFADSPSSAGTTARLHCAAGTWPGRIPKGQDVSALEERPE